MKRSSGWRRAPCTPIAAQLIPKAVNNTVPTLQHSDCWLHDWWTALVALAESATVGRSASLSIPGKEENNYSGNDSHPNELLIVAAKSMEGRCHANCIKCSLIEEMRTWKVWQSMPSAE